LDSALDDDADDADDDSKSAAALPASAAAPTCATRSAAADSSAASADGRRGDAVSMVLSVMACIRFPMLSANFIFDVVKSDESFLKESRGADPRLRKAWEAAVAEAIEYHACSRERKEVLPRNCRLSPASQRRQQHLPSSLQAGFQTFSWHIDNVSQLVPDQYSFGHAFFVDGYWFRLQAGRMLSPPPAAADHYAFALFLRIDLPLSGLSPDLGFLVQTESQFLIRNVESQSFQPTHGLSLEKFSSHACELGFFNVLKMPWADLLHSTFVEPNDAIDVSIRIRLVTQI
jgi:hypothetical protein